jgi:hypothetical protein
MRFMFLEFSFLAILGWRGFARLKNFRDQAMLVEEKTSGLVEPANLPKEWHRPQSEENREFAS